MYEGEEFRLPVEGGTGPGKPLKLLARPVQDRIPIYLGSMGPKAIERTAQIADGWLPSMFSPALAEPFRGTDIDISPVVMDEHLAHYERAGATTLLAMPFGDRPAIVDQLASSVHA